MHVQPLVPWRSTLPLDIPSFGFADRSTTDACSVMLAGPALRAFAIFHSSEWAAVVNVPGGNGAVAEERSSAKAVEEIATNPITAKRVLLTMRTSLFLPDACSRRDASMWVLPYTLAEGAYSRMAQLVFGVVSTTWRRPGALSAKGGLRNSENLPMVRSPLLSPIVVLGFYHRRVFLSGLAPRLCGFLVAILAIPEDAIPVA